MNYRIVMGSLAAVLTLTAMPLFAQAAEDLSELRDEAAGVTQQIAGALASKDKVDLTSLIEQLKQINEKLDKLQEEVDANKGWIAGQNKNLPIMSNDIANLKKFKFSNYVQFQYKSTDEANKAANNFAMRRMEFGVTSTIDPKTSMKLSFDMATGSDNTSAQLKEASLTYNIVPSAKKVGTILTIGQQNMPMGYEIARSSSVRELPERSLYNQKIFGGEFGRGVMLTQGLSHNLSAELGVWDALTVGDAEQSGHTPGSQLGTTAGLNWSGKNLTAGVNGFWATRPSFTGANSMTSPAVDRELYTADASYVGLLVPQLTLRGELMWGKDRLPNASGNASAFATKMAGYHVMANYNLNKRNVLSLKWEQFDPNTDTAGNAITGLGVSYIHYMNPGARVMAAYEAFLNEKNNPGERRFDITTLRLQYKL
ncbi:MAG: porin [Armatimonadota bacterium]